jgi:hypothetical protein
MACERPPAGRYAPRLSPFARGTLAQSPQRLCPTPVSPLPRGTAVERSDRQGVAHEPCLSNNHGPSVRPQLGLA